MTACGRDLQGQSTLVLADNVTQVWHHDIIGPGHRVD
jgi:hypothetical protein